MARLWFVELRVWFVGGGEGVSWFVWGGGKGVEGGRMALRDDVWAWEGRDVSWFATEGGEVGEGWAAPFHTERARSARVGSIVDAGVAAKMRLGVLRMGLEFDGRIGDS